MSYRAKKETHSNDAENDIVVATADSTNYPCVGSRAMALGWSMSRQYRTRLIVPSSRATSILSVSESAQYNLPVTQSHASPSAASIPPTTTLTAACRCDNPNTNANCTGIK